MNKYFFITCCKTFHVDNSSKKPNNYNYLVHTIKALTHVLYFSTYRIIILDLYVLYLANNGLILYPKGTYENCLSFLAVTLVLSQYFFTFVGVILC